MLNDINLLREKLEEQVLTNAPYEEILKTSQEIDSLLVEYYKTIDTLEMFI